MSRSFSKLGSGHGYREQPTDEGDCSCSQKQPEGKPALGFCGMDRAGGFPWRVTAGAEAWMGDGPCWEARTRGVGWGWWVGAGL